MRAVRGRRARKERSSSPAGAKNADAAQKVIPCATSKDYDLIAKGKGWASAPAGTRKSTYANPEFQKTAVIEHAAPRERKFPATRRR